MSWAIERNRCFWLCPIDRKSWSQSCHWFVGSWTGIYKKKGGGSPRVLIKNGCNHVKNFALNQKEILTLKPRRSIDSAKHKRESHCIAYLFSPLILDTCSITKSPNQNGDNHAKKVRTQNDCCWACDAVRTSIGNT